MGCTIHNTTQPGGNIVAGKEFRHLGFIDLEAGMDGLPILDNPQNGCPPEELHPKLEGPFCRLQLPTLPREAGVYIVVVDGRRVYVGIARILAERWNGYRKITLSNCQRNGQPTNCRVNHLILEARKRGQEVGLLFCKYETLEQRAIEELHPPWNLQ